MMETTELRYFSQYARCRCGKRSHGVLYGKGNDSYGPHCSRCASRRLHDSEAEREALQRTKIIGAAKGG